MALENDRVEVEVQIMNYQRIMARTTNAEFRRQAEDRIAELERKLLTLEQVTGLSSGE